MLWVVVEGLLKETPAGHEDLKTIPAILDVIKDLEKEMESGQLNKRLSCGGVMPTWSSKPENTLYVHSVLSVYTL